MHSRHSACAFERCLSPRPAFSSSYKRGIHAKGGLITSYGLLKLGAGWYGADRGRPGGVVSLGGVLRGSTLRLLKRPGCVVRLRAAPARRRWFVRSDVAARPLKQWEGAAP